VSTETADTPADPGAPPATGDCPWLAPPAHGLRARWRQLWRTAAVGLVTAVVYSLTGLGAALLRRRPRRRSAFQHALFRHWSRLLLRALGGRLTVQGPPPSTPYLLVSNHLSWVDILTLGACVGGVFVARADLDGWPLVGAICRVVDTLFIDRASKRDLLRVAGLAERRLAAGGGVIFFVEGTTGHGDRILPFKPSLLEVAAQTRTPVHYATLAYRTPAGEPPASQAVSWWGDAPFIPHAARLASLPGFEARVTFGAEPVIDGDRKQLAAHLREAMEAIFEPTD
jgi:1-acyl-sn-glycerol-3-phosphate acyltransferase